MVDTPNPLLNWSESEKLYLFEALKSSEPVNIQVLRERIPTKTDEELEAGIEEFRKLPATNPYFESSAGAAGGSAEVLTQWQQVLAGAMDPEELCRKTAEGLRKIAESEDIPPPEQTNKIDFREVYMQIANAMEGKPIFANRRTAVVLEQCINETSIRSQQYLMALEMLDFIKRYKLDVKETPRMACDLAHDEEVHEFRRMILERREHPLVTPERFLVFPSTVTITTDDEDEDDENDTDDDE